MNIPLLIAQSMPNFNGELGERACLMFVLYAVYRVIMKILDYAFEEIKPILVEILTELRERNDTVELESVTTRAENVELMQRLKESTENSKEPQSEKGNNGGD